MESRHDNELSEDAGLQAPDCFVSALKKLPAQPIFIPSAIDETILRAAQRHLVEPTRGGLFQFWRWVVPGAAAVILIALIPQFAGKQPPAQVVPAFSTQDLNRDGTFDILDAFTLARQIKAGVSPDRELDFNDDGRVDDFDSAILASRAVQLEKGGRS